MIFKNKMNRILLLIAVVLFLFSCGEKAEEAPLILSGTVNLNGAGAGENIPGPVFVAVIDSDDFESIQSNPADAIITLISIDEGNYTYCFDLSESGLKEGNRISVLAFVDNDYEGGLPNVNSGDFVGFFTDPDTMSPSYVLKSGHNENIDININREVFSFDKEISGTIYGDYIGEIIVFAYAGEINSFNLSDLDFGKFIGYRKISKDSSEIDYKLTILPFGFDLPIDNVYIFTIYDDNENGIPDSGESIGYYTIHPGQMPTLITISYEDQTDIDIGMIMELPEPSGYDISIIGYFDPSSDYNTSSEPIFIVVAKTGDPEEVLTLPLNTIKYFEKLSPGEADFDIDLSSTDLVPGDEVMVIALWDKDYVGGFPDSTNGDYIGYYQNKEHFLISVSLSEGVNSIVPSEDWSFSVNKKIFDHSSSISFQLQEGGRVSLDNGDQVIVVAVQGDGIGSDFMINDIDYVIAMKTVTVNEDYNYYNINILPALFEGIVGDPFEINDVYVYAILDENGNDRPDKGEPIGFYWRWFLILFPKATDISDGSNQLDRTVRFTSNTF